MIGNSGLFSHEMEYIFMFAGSALGAFVLFRDKAKHNYLLPLVLFTAGSLIIMAREAGLVLVSELTLTIVGSLLSVSAYFFNWKYRKACACKH